MAELRVKSTGTIKLFESDNTSSVTIASPASLSANKTITLPDADVTLASGTMLATDGSGASLTALNASELGSGTVPTARLGSGTASSSTVLYGDQTYKTEPGGGMTHLDTYSYNTDTDTTGATLASWTRTTSWPGLPLGTGWTESSGIFTAPATGFYEIDFQLVGIDRGNATSYWTISIVITDDDFSSETSAITGNGHIEGTAGLQIGKHISMIFDCTDVDNDKVKFGVNFGGQTNGVIGNAGSGYTSVQFMRLADT